MKARVKKAKVFVTEGGGWGDEGKGKVSTYFTQQATKNGGNVMTIRATGGGNAGHTVFINGTKVATHLVPGGIGYPGVICLIGKGTLIEPEILFPEMMEIEKLGVSDVWNRVFIDEMANILLPCHKAVEKLQDWTRKRPIGTTGKGMGPGFGDATTRFGIKAKHLTLPIEKLTEAISEVYAIHEPLIKEYDKWLKKKKKGHTDDSRPEIFECEEWKAIKKEFKHPENIAVAYKVYGVMLNDMDRKQIIDGFEFVTEFKANPKNTIIVEGAQSISLSITEGLYPMVTSSDANTLGTLSGANLNHKDPTEVVVIFKAYLSKVGNGAMVTEMPSHIDSKGKLLSYNPEDAYLGDIYRDCLGEYGATTGRPRRIGYFDAVQAKTSVEKAGADYICINCIDSLGEIGEKVGELRICSAYLMEDGTIVNHCPQTLNITGNIPIPLYGDNDECIIKGGWKVPTDAKTYADLPEKAKEFIGKIEELVGCKVKYIGIGPHNEDLIVREDV